MEPARPKAQRKSDALRRLREDKDLWLASADLEGNPCLVPLSFYWDGTSLFFATVVTNPTACNVMKTATARAALGHTRDVVLIEASAQRLERDEVSDRLASAYRDKCGWDPQEAAGYGFFRLIPRWVESWRELNEHPDRRLMHDGRWLV
jgi:hypothetical protein